VPGKNTAGFSASSKVSDQVPLETCQTIYHSWGYDVNDYNYKSPDELIRFLVQTAGKGANLLLNVGPRPDGTLPEESVNRLLAIGKWLEKYGDTIYGTDGGCVPEQPWGVTTQSGKTLYVHVLNHADAILVPLKGNKLVSAVTFEDGQKVPFTQVSEGIVLSLPAKPENCPDQIVTLTFKNVL
jgi:alpha-L-fucosidase